MFDIENETEIDKSTTRQVNRYKDIEISEKHLIPLNSQCLMDYVGEE